jgi:DNA polymerase
LESLKAAGVDWLPVASAQAAAETKPDRAKPAALPAPPPALPAAETPSLFGMNGGTNLSVEERRHELTLLAEKVSGCTRCAQLATTRTQTVFGVGQPGVELCFIGEAPGADEDRQGEPFVGAAGQLLNRILAACKLQREEVYICNVIKCRPPGNRTPLPDEAENCREYLERQLELVQPKFICCLGTSAAQHLLCTTRSLGQLRGRFHDYRGIPVMVTYHPAYLLPHRNPGKKKDVWEDMKMLMAKMGRPVQ